MFPADVGNMWPCVVYSVPRFSLCKIVIVKINSVSFPPQETHGSNWAVEVHEWVSHQAAGRSEGSHEHHDVHQVWRQTQVGCYTNISSSPVCPTFHHPHLCVCVCRRFEMDREPSEARFCAECNRCHSAEEGDLWAESSMLGLRITYFACMDGKVYDITGEQ